MPGTQALLFRPGPTLGDDALRVARALLEDAVRRRGGRLGPLPGGGYRLEGAAAALDAARDSLAAVLRGRDATVMDDRRADPPAVPVARDVPEDRIAALPLRALIRLDPVLGFGPGGIPYRLALRALPDEDAIAQTLGPRWSGPPYAEHARNLVAARLLREGAGWPGPLHLYAGEGPLPALPPGILPLRPPRALADPGRRPYGVVGLHAAAPVGLAAAGADILYLPLSPMGEPTSAALATLGRRRIILDGVADADALARAAASGVLGAAGPAAARALAASVP